jgi:hypothetical protein
MTEETDPNAVNLKQTMLVAEVADTHVTMDRLTKIYIKMREKLSALTKAYEAEEERIKTQQAEVASAMKDIMRTVGGTGMKTAYGTVSLRTSTRFYAQDWDAMYQFINDNQAPFLLEKRVAQKNMADFLEVNPGTVPPGLNTVSEITVAVTKNRS